MRQRSCLPNHQTIKPSDAPCFFGGLSTIRLVRQFRDIGATWPSIVAYPLVRRINGECRLTFRDGTKFAAPCSRPFLFLLREIWLDECYRMPEMHKRPKEGHIVDLGAYIGMFAVWAAKQWPSTTFSP